MKTISATELEEKAQSLLDELAATGEPVTIVSHGEPVAQLVPAPKPFDRYPQLDLKGSVTVIGEIVEPLTSSERIFTLEYWRDEGWYVGRLKEVPGVFSQGETLAQLEDNIRDAYRLLIESNDEPAVPADAQQLELLV